VEIGLKECSKCENNLRCKECALPHVDENLKAKIEELKYLLDDKRKQVSKTSEYVKVLGNVIYFPKIQYVSFVKNSLLVSGMYYHQIDIKFKDGEKIELVSEDLTLIKNDYEILENTLLNYQKAGE
jgi:hypothetical protein